jgi:hypothetical protein
MDLHSHSTAPGRSNVQVTVTREEVFFAADAQSRAAISLLILHASSVTVLCCSTKRSKAIDYVIPVRVNLILLNVILWKQAPGTKSAILSI